MSIYYYTSHDVMLITFLHFNGYFPAPFYFLYMQAPPVGGPGYQFPMVAVAPQQPPYDAPHDFLFLAMVTTIICGILNLISLSLGIPAIILSVMVRLTISCNHNHFLHRYTWTKVQPDIFILRLHTFVCACVRAYVRAGGDRKPFDPRQTNLFSGHR